MASNMGRRYGSCGGVASRTPRSVRRHCRSPVRKRGRKLGRYWCGVEDLRHEGHLIDQFPPGLPLGGRHQPPALGVLQELRAIIGAETGKFLERMKALNSLGGRQLAKTAEGF